MTSAAALLWALPIRRPWCDWCGSFHRQPHIAAYCAQTRAANADAPKITPTRED